jgi:putative oxidoreductase
VLEKVLRLRRMLLGLIEKLAWLGPLLARLTVGVVFLASGWGKIHNLEKVTAFFTDLGIPFPAQQAVFVALVELVGGTCMVLGLAARLMSIPLVIMMVVAIATAQREQVTGFVDLFGLVEWTLLVLCAWIGLQGPGAMSVDRAIDRVLTRSQP